MALATQCEKGFRPLRRAFVSRGARLRLAGVLLSTLVASSWGCGGSGSDDDGAGPATTSTIEGRVANVEQILASAGAGATLQGAQRAGIRVDVLRGDRALDSAITDLDGQFRLEFVGDGRVDLVFAVDGVTLELGLDVPPGSTVALLVELRLVERRVVILDEELREAFPIRCETGRVSISDAQLDLFIDGRGEDCIRVAGNCTVDIRARSVTLVDCERCIDAHGTSEVRIATDPDAFACAASGDGIRAGGTARVAIDAAGRLDIGSDRAVGIRADGTAQVIAASDGTCRVEADEGIQVRGAATVDLDGCATVSLR